MAAGTRTRRVTPNTGELLKRRSSACHSQNHQDRVKGVGECVSHAEGHFVFGIAVAVHVAMVSLCLWYCSGSACSHVLKEY